MNEQYKLQRGAQLYGAIQANPRKSWILTLLYAGGSEREIKEIVRSGALAERECRLLARFMETICDRNEPLRMHAKQLGEDLT